MYLAHKTMTKRCHISVTVQVKIWFQNHRSKSKKILRQKQQKPQQQQQQQHQQQQRMSESGNEDDDGQCINSRHHQPQQPASITPPLTPRAVSDWATVKDEPRAHSSASSSSSSASSLDAVSYTHLTLPTILRV